MPFSGGVILLSNKIKVVYIILFIVQCKNTSKTLHKSSKEDALKTVRDMEIYNIYVYIFNMHARIIEKMYTQLQRAIY